MRLFKSITIIISIPAIIVTLLSLASTSLCRKFDIIADFPLSLIGTAVVFPIVFSINGAYKRREVVLREYGNIKAHGRALFFATRDWLAESDDKIQGEMKDLLGNLLKACRELFRTPIDIMDPQERDVYAAFSKLSVFIKGFRSLGMAGGEVSRSNQFLSKIMISFENIKHIYQYRTPRTLRTYSKVFLHLLPVLYGPYFAAIAREYSAGTIYIMPILFSIVLVSLDNIQEHLENPFDQIGEDDVNINAEKFVERLDL